MACKKHEFVKRIVHFHECKECSADGCACEACGKITDVDVMSADSEGAWFCPKCYRGLIAAKK